MATAYLLRKGKTYTLGFPGDASSLGVQQNGEVGSDCDSASISDIGGNNVATAYFNVRKYFSFTVVAAEMPEVGSSFSYGGINGTITDVSLVGQNDATAMMLTISGETYYE